LVVQGKRVIRPGSSGPASIHIQDRVIMAIEKFDSAPAGIELVDAGDSVVMPGLVDTHVHLNEPGRAEWEGFHFGTRAAAAGDCAESQRASRSRGTTGPDRRGPPDNWFTSKL